MSGAIWLVYMVLALGAFIWIFLLLAAGAYDSLSASQAVGLFLTFFIVWVAVGFGSLSPFIVIIVLAASPFILLGFEFLRRRAEALEKKSILAKELNGARAFLEQHPEDAFPLEQMGDLYETLGEHALAAQFYDRAAEACGSNRVISDPYRSKAKESRDYPHPRESSRDPLVAPWCACLMCGDINSRHAPACVNCGHHLFPTGVAGFVIRFRELIEGDLFQAVAIGGLIALPFYLLIGPWPHDLLWGLLSVAFWLSSFRRPV